MTDSPHIYENGKIKVEICVAEGYEKPCLKPGANEAVVARQLARVLRDLNEEFKRGHFLNLAFKSSPLHIVLIYRRDFFNNEAIDVRFVPGAEKLARSNGFFLLTDIPAMSLSNVAARIRSIGAYEPASAFVSAFHDLLTLLVKSYDAVPTGRRLPIMNRHITSNRLATLSLKQA
jgi:hypothetical protein